ncbi:MAG: type II secretion system inner membrane protein GspF [Desulfobacteraceae bacterium]|nr:type II secretion system inner membrane protein GspF [Desulfobacteraceae bacterium]
MPVYEYSALDAKGKSITGMLDADSEVMARQKIRAAGNFPVNLKAVKNNSTEKSGTSRFSFSQFFTRISPGEVAIMTRQLATLIGAGFPLVSALESLVAQINSPGLKKVIAGIKGTVVEGSTFANAMGKYPRVFTPIYVNMVASGESSGTLEIVLERLADITEKQEALKSRMITAMIYPLLILAISILIVSFLLMFVVPKIMSMFENMKQTLPLPTRILIGTSNTFKSYWWVLVLLLIAVLLGIQAAYRNEKGRRWIDTRVLSVPLFGALVRKLAAARFARTLGSLLDNGVSMLPAMGIVHNVVGNVFIADVVTDGAAEVSKGKGLGKALDKPKAFPPLAIQMIQVGEQSGNLEEMLGKVADVFEKEVETTTMRLTAMVEPIMVLLMAGIVLFIVLAICLPIFEMNQLVK